MKSKVIKSLTKLIFKPIDMFCFILIINFYFFKRLFFKTINYDVMFFGAPIINVKYIFDSLTVGGARTLSIVPFVYEINKASDFDIVTLKYSKVLKEVFKSDVVFLFFDSLDVYFSFGQRRILIKALKFSGVKLIVAPYGSDSFEYEKINDLTVRHCLLLNYYQDSKFHKKVRRNVEFMLENADFVIGCIMHIDNLYRWDILPVHYFPFTKDISNLSYKKPTDKILITHSPNHKGIKGTSVISKAIDELKSEGFNIELKILHRLTNDEVLEEVSKSHIFIDQLFLGAYALSGIEAMSMGIPVITYMNPRYKKLFETFSYLKDCPVIHTEASVGDIKKVVLETIEDRVEIGKKSKEFIKKYYSQEFCLKMWIDIIKAVKAGRRLNDYFCDKEFV